MRVKSSMGISVVAVALGVGGAAPAAVAEDPQMIRDFDSVNAPEVLNLDELTAGDSTLFFRAYDSARGHELWTSDGTEDGTDAIKDINPGEASSSPRSIKNIGGRVVFTADDGVHGVEPWISDGTEQGTRMLRDIAKGGVGSFAYSFTKVGRWIYFGADAPEHGTELWKSDGTRQGTQLVENIRHKRGDADPLSLAKVGHRLFFQARDGDHGAELWTSDGTRPGTRMVRDIFPGAHASDPTGMFNLNGVLLFSAGDGSGAGHELWRSDGTRAGTVRVEDINPGSGSSGPGRFTEYTGTAFFDAYDGTDRGLWRSDGTAEGTSLVSQHISLSPNYAVLDGTLYFRGKDAEFGTELWRTDGTPEGTSRVSDVWPGPDPSLESFAPPGDLTSFAGALFFYAQDEDHGTELWTSDGTAEGTSMLADIDPAEPSGVLQGHGWPRDFTPVGDTLFFHAHYFSDEELWSYTP